MMFSIGPSSQTTSNSSITNGVLDFVPPADVSPARLFSDAMTDIDGEAASTTSSFLWPNLPTFGYEYPGPFNAIDCLPYFEPSLTTRQPSLVNEQATSASEATSSARNHPVNGKVTDRPKAPETALHPSMPMGSSLVT